MTIAKTATSPVLHAAPETATIAAGRVAKAVKPENFLPFGNHGISFCVQGDNLVVVIPIGKSARASAPMSSTGKNKLLANSGGWNAVPNTDLRMNLGVMIPPNAG